MSLEVHLRNYQPFVVYLKTFKAYISCNNNLTIQHVSLYVQP